MSVKIITDSTSDISPEVAQAFGITIVPGYVRFGSEVFRDGIDISNNGFYQKLLQSPFHPTTSEPTLQDFARVYSDCPAEMEGIISIHISSKISNTCRSAQKGKKMCKGKQTVEIVDSLSTSIGLSLVVMAAARLSNAGESLPNILKEAKETVSQIGMLGILDTMKYLALGGRVSQRTAAVSKMFQVKPLITFKNGEIVREGLVRSYASGVDRLYAFVKDTPFVKDLAIAYSTVPEQAIELRKRLGSIFPEEKILVAQLGAALGAHGGPGVLLAAVRHIFS